MDSAQEAAEESLPPPTYVAAEQTGPTTNVNAGVTTYSPSYSLLIPHPSPQENRFNPFAALRSNIGTPHSQPQTSPNSLQQQNPALSQSIEAQSDGRSAAVTQQNPNVKNANNDQVRQQVQNQQPSPIVNPLTAPNPTFQQQTYGNLNNQPQFQPQPQYIPPGGYPNNPGNANLGNYNPALGGYPQGPVIQVVSPLHILGPGPGAVQCPNCGTRGITVVTYETGSTTHLWAVVACAFICLPCIPYLINETKDVRHTCASCGTSLATYRRSGGTIVHAFGRL